MIHVQIEQLADSIRETMGSGLPSNPLQIAKDEGILLGPGDFRESFLGRIEYHPNKDKFLLLYPQQGNQRRIRFSLSHELGHYYIEGHRQLLMTGQAHNSMSGFICDDQLEREADTFAAALLIPRYYIEQSMKTRGFMTLSNILKMADDCETSITCAAIRYVQYAAEPCAAVLSENGKVLFGITSDEMGAIGLKVIRRGTVVPDNSPTANCMVHPNVNVIVEGKSDSAGWFANRYKTIDLWEESIPLGYSGQYITLLACNSEEPEE
ncbi:MAG TPA: hypothetical protein DCZ95_13150 [Verrucomicrobia bacterium]|nr:MAG: hypothetical protein A2X46_11515 [Lentisphaerae bacterium GWF2_57_35]HBA85034.1 hypothetical protein [Verrucomicrobiota bacterium]